MARYSSNRFRNRLAQDGVTKEQCMFAMLKWAKSHGLPDDVREAFVQKMAEFDEKEDE